MTGAGRPISSRELNRALLARQFLLDRSDTSPSQAIEHLVGLQAQAPGPPYIGLWTRLAGFAFDDLADLVAGRQVVRLALMRNTIHLVTAPDAVCLRALLQPMMARSFAASAYAKQLVGLDLDAVTEAGRTAVENQPLTFAALGALLAETWPDRPPAALAQVVRAHVPLVQVPPRGLWGQSGQARHTSLEAWLEKSAAADHATLADLVLRYFRAFGPGSVADIQAWSGLTRLRPVVDGLADRLTIFSDDAGTDLYDLPEGPRPDPASPAPLRFVPEYDNILLAHADRSRIIDDEARAAMQSANGVVPGTVLIDGFVGAFWKITDDRQRATLTVTALGRLTRAQRADITSEGQSLLAAAAPGVPSHDLVIESG